MLDSSLHAFDGAHQLLQPGELGLCLLTDGRFFTRNVDGTGSTGIWVLNPQRQVDRIIIFHQVQRQERREVDLYTALPDGATGPDADGRYTLHLREVQQAGTTDKRWQEFAQAGSNPVRYLTGISP